jgi:hypothetical protein
MKKYLLILAGAAAAAGMFYLSRTEYPPKNEQVQGALGGKRLTRGSTVCVNKLQNLSEKQVSLEGVDDDLVGQLNNAGFKGRLISGQGKQDAPGAKPDCEGIVYGEIVNLKGKDRVEAEVEFRLMIAGDQTPFLSSRAKGKSREAVNPALAKQVTMGVLPKAAKNGDKAGDTAAATREALMAAFAEVAKQIEQQRPAASTRASAE